MPINFITLKLVTDKTQNSPQEFKIDPKIKGTIFDALDDQGVKLAYGCLAGSCGVCQIEILQGAEFLGAPSAIELNTLEGLKKMGRFSEGKTYRLSCRAKFSQNAEGKLIVIQGKLDP